MNHKLYPFKSLKRVTIFHWNFVLLVIFLISLVQASPVSAAPNGVLQQQAEYLFQLTAEQDAIREGAPVCAGDEVSIIVRAWFTKSGETGNKTRQFAVGVPVDALVQDGSIVSLTSKSRSLTSLALEETGSAVFTFKAKKPGQTKVIFEALFPEQLIRKADRKNMSANDLRETRYAEVQTSIWVIECPLELTVMNQYSSQQGEVMWQVISLADRIALRPDPMDENKFTYEGIESVVITEKLPDCKVTWQKGERLVRVTAVREGNMFRVLINRDQFGFSVTHECEGGTETTSLNIPEAEEQEWIIPVKGGQFSRSNRFPLLSTWHVMIAKPKK